MEVSYAIACTGGVLLRDAIDGQDGTRGPLDQRRDPAQIPALVERAAGAVLSVDGISKEYTPGTRDGVAYFHGPRADEYRDRRGLRSGDHGSLRREDEDRGGGTRPAPPGRSADDPGTGFGHAGCTRDGGTASRRSSWRAGVILADTSAWVEYDRATGSPVEQRLTALID